MKRPCVLAALVLIAPAVFSSSVSGSENIALRPGFQKILDYAGVTRLSIGNPDVIEASPLPKSSGVLVVGKKEGETDLVVWSKGAVSEVHVTVREPKPDPLDEVKTFAAAFPGVLVRQAGPAVIVSGTVAGPRDKALLEEFAKNRPNIHLQVALPEEKKTLLAYDLKIIEISRGAASQLGVKWPDTVSLQASASQDSRSGFVFTLESGFAARLDLLLADGRARILANPRLVCESGAKATFLAGGEIPIMIATPETRTVEWKTYGIVLDIAPRMGSGDTIRTQITAEISAVDHGSGSGSVPAFLTRRVTTFFSTPPGSTVMLSGLVKSEMAKDVSKVPLLGQIPVLGELFKSRSFRENQSELAIFITPKKVQADAAEDLSAWDRKAEREKENLSYRLLD